MMAFYISNIELLKRNSYIFFKKSLYWLILHSFSPCPPLSQLWMRISCVFINQRTYSAKLRIAHSFHLVLKSSLFKDFFQVKIQITFYLADICRCWPEYLHLLWLGRRFLTIYQQTFIECHTLCWLLRTWNWINHTDLFFIASSTLVHILSHLNIITILQNRMDKEYDFHRHDN